MWLNHFAVTNLPPSSPFVPWSGPVDLEEHPDIVPGSLPLV